MGKCENFINTLSSSSCCRSSARSCCWPICRVLQVAFFGLGQGGKPGTFTFAYLAAVFRDAEFRGGLINSALIAVGVTILCTLISVPLALMSVRFNFWGKGFVTGLLLVPLILPPFVGAIGMRQILGRFGVLTSAGPARRLRCARFTGRLVRHSPPRRHHADRSAEPVSRFFS